ncbi:MAG: hypothetical protein FWD01_00365 [Defluviitaleaceae bacterium]|nr:hypothetical protein [Defluviitaleaceae bacterium]
MDCHASLAMTGGVMDCRASLAMTGRFIIKFFNIGIIIFNIASDEVDIFSILL